MEELLVDKAASLSTHISHGASDISAPAGVTSHQLVGEWLVMFEKDWFMIG